MRKGQNFDEIFEVLKMTVCTGQVCAIKITFLVQTCDQMLE